MSLNYFVAQQRNSVNHFNYYYFRNAFTPSEIIKIREVGDSLAKERGSVVSDDMSSQVSDYRVSDIAWIENTPETYWLYEKIAEYASIANREMNWNFDIWGYLDHLQYTTYYGNGGHYDWHVDMGPGISNRKLSVVLQLSDPEEYEGGDLEMNPGGNILQIPKELGLITFFPSFLLHRVTPVTSGTRTSLVTWLCGANFR